MDPVSAEAIPRDVLLHITEGCQVVGFDWRYLYVNDAVTKQGQRSREEMLGRTMMECYPGIEQTPLFTALRQCLGDRQPRRLDTEFPFPDGSRWFELRIFPVPQGMCVFSVDVTEARAALAQARREVLAAEAMAARILDVSDDAIVSIDEQQRITLFNQGAERTFGYSKEEILGAPLDRLMPERFRRGHLPLVARFSSEGGTSRRVSERPGKLVGLRKNGEEFPLDAALSRIDLDGAVHLTVALRDITEQRRLEQDQQFLVEVGTVFAESLDSEQTLRNVARLSTRELADFCMVGVVGERGAIRRIECAGRDPAKGWVCELLRRLPLEPDPAHPAFQAMETKRPVLLPEVPPETMARFAQGDLHLQGLLALEARSMLALPLVAGGKALGVLGLVWTGRTFGPADVQLAEELARRAALALENARLYGDARRAVQARDDLLGIVAHDLRNPLQSVLLQARLLRARASDGAEWVRRPSEVVERAVSRMARLIQDLLDVGRIEAGKLALALDRVPVEPLLHEALEAQRVLAAAAAIELHLEPVPPLAALWADRDRLLQVFENLLGNALKFTARGGRVAVGVEHSGAELVFRVTDTGKGIPADELPRLFERFWQADRASRNGAGLGLPIARGIVQAHGGRIWVESAPGQGTTVHVAVPLAGPPAAKAPEAAP